MTLEKVLSTSMVDHSDKQRIDLWITTEKPYHGFFKVMDAEGKRELAQEKLAAAPGKNHCVVMLPAIEKNTQVQWCLCDKSGEVLEALSGEWKAPRHWKLYFMVSSHTDIGLHNSQYHQRYYSEKFLDQAMELCDRTEDRPEEDRYHYIMEGTWFWENYPQDRGIEAARKVVSDYIQQKKIGLCVGVAGNHTQTFGLEEMCRATQGRKRTRETWGVDCHTMTMIDNNGLSWAMIQPFAEAGYENIIFAPNQWNPLYSTVWHMNSDTFASTWNTEAGGGGARIDMRYDSALPRVFYWLSADGKSKLLVWSGGNYGGGASVFGLEPSSQASIYQLRMMEEKVAKQLPLMEEKYPWNLWFCACYNDDQAPEMGLTDSIRDFNAKWKWPQMATCGDPDRPFNELRENFDKEIPVIQGEITGGWYQHPVAAAELLGAKLNADRDLATAEKLSVLAGLMDGGYRYPAEAYQRAWNMLLWNDEHSYGTSGYQGRRVYETWLQHRDWIEKAQATADSNIEEAMACIGRQLKLEENALLVVNPTAQERCEVLTWPDGRRSEKVTVPPVGYLAVPESAFHPAAVSVEKTFEPPMVENSWYRLSFGKDGSLRSIYDRELNRELLDTEAEYGANTFVYTTDNHASFTAPKEAEFTVEESEAGIRVTVSTQEAVSGAAITQIITLPAAEKRIDIENHLDHVRDMFNTHRYYRYAYYAFPWKLENAKRYCHLNGCVAEYAVDVTGHGTDTYMASNEWCCAESDGIGIGMVQLDSELVEFDHIHPDKTDFGDAGSGAGMYYYLANDWLQMHTSGGSQLNYLFRYSITSYRGGYAEVGLPELAERIANPLRCCPVKPGEGERESRHSFFGVRDGCRLVGLKRAEDGKGIIARLYSLRKNESGGLHCEPWSVVRNTVDEEPMAEESWQGFETLRVGQESIRMETRPIPERHGEGTIHATIGDTYTGLIDHPRAARGEMEGHLYLLWGAVMEKDLAGYKVYRGLKPDFVANERSLIGCSEPECYRVGRYIDTNLERNTRYYYRVCAYDKQGRCGPLSEVFSALTKE